MKPALAAVDQTNSKFYIHRIKMPRSDEEHCGAFFTVILLFTLRSIGGLRGASNEAPVSFFDKHTGSCNPMVTTNCGLDLGQFSPAVFNQ